MRFKSIILSAFVLIVCTFESFGKTQEEVFGDALWIGQSDTIQPLFPQHLTVFTLEWDATPDAWIKLGKGDERLTNKYRNLWHIEAPADSIYIKLAVDCDEGALKFSRNGMFPGERPDSVQAIIDAPSLTDKSTHKIRLDVAHGHTEVYVDGQLKGKVNLNPVMGPMTPPKWETGDFLAFPCLGGVEVYPAGSHFTVRNRNAPSNIIAKDKVKPYSQPVLRRHWNQQGPVAKATLYVTARGIYDCFVNDKAIAPDEFYNPGFTQYDRTHLYQTYDITDFINQGPNALQFTLSEGWWSGPATYIPAGWNSFGDRSSLIARLIIEDNDGNINEIVSDTTWQVASDSPRMAGSMFQGEVYDGRKSLFDDCLQWHDAVEVPTNGTTVPTLDFSNIEFLPQTDSPVHPIDTLTAVSRTEVRPGIWVYDMGQNCAGVPYITLSGMTPGSRLTLRFAEVLYPDLPQFGDLKGELMLESIRAAHAQDQYICAGGEETFSPRHTMHGYRYLEISGTDTPLDITQVKTLALSSLDSVTASYECSNPLINQLWNNILWSMRSNFVSIPTDCPQRNERLGWSGDINVFSHTATYLSDTESFLRRHMRAMRDTQTPEGRFTDIAPMRNIGFGGLLWGSAGIELPWQCWQQWGDTTVLKENYEAMVEYMNYIEGYCIDRKSNIITQNYPAWGDLGDWLSPEDDRNDPSLLWEAYYIHNLDIMDKIAILLGNTGDAARFAETKAKRKQFFINTYIDPITNKTIRSAYGNGTPGTDVDTYTSYLLPIAFDVVDADTREKLADNLENLLEKNNYALNVGFVGVAQICETLSVLGRDDIAYRLLTREEYPSWIYSVNQGATTIWERLNSYVKGEGFPAGNAMNSFNHYSFGSIGSWMIERSLGICRDTDNPGFRHFILQPTPDTTGSITWAKGHYDTRHGRIESAWYREGNKVTYTFAIPTGTTATVRLPGLTPKEFTPGLYTVTLKH